MSELLAPFTSSYDSYCHFCEFTSSQTDLRVALSFFFAYFSTVFFYSPRKPSTWDGIDGSTNWDNYGIISDYHGIVAIYPIVTPP